MGVSFWLITLAMIGAAALFFLERRRLPTNWQAHVTVAGVVALISAINYHFLTGIWVSAGNVSTVYRVVDWQLTVPLKVISYHLVLTAMAAVSAALFCRLLVSSAIMIAAAYLGAANYLSPTLGFLVSPAGGPYILGELYLGEASKINANSGKEWAQSAFIAIRLIVTVGWAIYPLGYFMEHLGGGVDSGSINLIYNLADFLNKIAFGLVIYRAAVRDPAPERRG